MNHAEAAAIAEQIEKVVTDPAYQGRSIGVNALHSKAQAVELEAQVRRRIRTEDFKRLQIRVG